MELSPQTLPEYKHTPARGLKLLLHWSWIEYNTCACSWLVGKQVKYTLTAAAGAAAVGAAEAGAASTAAEADIDMQLAIVARNHQVAAAGAAAATALPERPGCPGPFNLALLGSPRA